MLLFVCYTAVSYLSLTNSSELFFLCFALSWKNEILSAKIPALGNTPFSTPCVFRVVTSHVESCWCGRLVPPLCGRAILQSPPNNGPWRPPQSCLDPPYISNVPPMSPPHCFYGQRMNIGCLHGQNKCSELGLTFPEWRFPESTPASQNLRFCRVNCSG